MFWLSDESSAGAVVRGPLFIKRLVSSWVIGLGFTTVGALDSKSKSFQRWKAEATNLLRLRAGSYHRVTFHCILLAKAITEPAQIQGTHPIEKCQRPCGQI